MSPLSKLGWFLAAAGKIDTISYPPPSNSNGARLVHPLNQQSRFCTVEHFWELEQDNPLTVSIRYN